MTKSVSLGQKYHYKNSFPNIGYFDLFLSTLAVNAGFITYTFARSRFFANPINNNEVENKWKNSGIIKVCMV